MAAPPVIDVPLIYAGELPEPTPVTITDDAGEAVNVSDVNVTTYFQVADHPTLSRSCTETEPLLGKVVVPWQVEDFIVTGPLRGTVVYTVDGKQRVAATLRGRVVMPPASFNPLASNGESSEGVVRRNFSRKRGDTWEFLFVFEYGGRRLDLTGSTWEMDLRASGPDGELLGSCTFDLTRQGAGEVIARLDDDTTGEAEPGAYFYDLQQSRGDATATPFEGVVFVSEDIS